MEIKEIKLINKDKLKNCGVKKNILFIDNEEKDKKTFTRLFKKYFKEIVAVFEKEALQTFIKKDFDIVIINIDVALIQEILNIKEEQKIIVLLSPIQNDLDIFIDLISLNINSFVLKPLSFNTMANKLIFALSNQQVLDDQDDNQDIDKMSSMIIHQWEPC
jgi:DNA-binding NtrC family response regulator